MTRQAETDAAADILRAKRAQRRAVGRPRKAGSAVADPTAFMPNDARLESVEIKLRNLGIAERFYALTAKGAGISQDAVRDGLAAVLDER